MQSTSHSIHTAPPGEGKDSTSPPPPKLAVQLVHHHDLFVAASAGDLLTSRALLDRGLRLIVGAGNLTDSLGRLDVNAVNADGATAMYIAAAHGHTALVEVLADEGNADVNLGTPEDSTLQLVEAWKDKPPGFVRGRRHGAVFPLYIAARNGKVDTVRALLQRGAEVDQLTNLFDGAEGC
jgi:ankyrin repeat protein